MIHSSKNSLTKFKSDVLRLRTQFKKDLKNTITSYEALNESLASYLQFSGRPESPNVAPSESKSHEVGALTGRIRLQGNKLES